MCEAASILRACALKSLVDLVPGTPKYASETPTRYAAKFHRSSIITPSFPCLCPRGIPSPPLSPSLSLYPFVYSSTPSLRPSAHLLLLPHIPHPLSLRNQRLNLKRRPRQLARLCLHTGINPHTRQCSPYYPAGEI